MSFRKANQLAVQGVSLAPVSMHRMACFATGKLTHSNRRCPMQSNEFQEQESFRDDEQAASGISV